MIDYRLNLITDVDEEPLSLDDATIHSRIDLGSPADADEQAYVEDLFVAVRKAVEESIFKPIGIQEFELALCYFPCDWVIELPMPPMASLVSIKYTKQDGSVGVLYDATASPAVTSDIFTVDMPKNQKGKIFLKTGESWPIDVLQTGYPVKIRFTAGIDVSLPENAAYMQLLRFCFGQFYENREPVTDGRASQPFAVPMTFQWLVDKVQFQVMR
jgi:hypothetical protein